MKDIIIAVLVTFVGTFMLVVNIEMKLDKERAKNGFMTIDGATYSLSRVSPDQ